MNYLITGFPGMGKSSIALELKKRGHIAYDPQKMQGYTYTENRQTGRRLNSPERTPRGWYDDTAAFKWNSTKLDQLLDSKDDVFICSLAQNQSAFYDKFRLIFVLTLDDVELEQRLNHRENRAIGHEKNELADILMLHMQFEQGLINNGAIALAASKPLNELVNEILNHVTSKKLVR